MNSFEHFDYNRADIESPSYVIEEELLHNNLRHIKRVEEEAGIQIIMAFKSFAMWKLFSITRNYIPYSTASSLAEARLAYEELGSKAHTFAPIYRDDEIEEIARCSSHITFNSLAQFNRHRQTCISHNISCGVRINPEYSDVETDLYNPCAPGSRFGIIRDQLPAQLPEGIEGLHFHTLCESNSYDLENTLKVVEEKFGTYFSQIKWINMGGGHLMTKAGYDADHLISLLREFKSRYPHLQIILEPGSAHVWRTGVLVATVQDIVENHGISTAILDVSFACHMPDCLEMPYQPNIIGATTAATDSAHPEKNIFAYRMGGNSCLSGDFVGDWFFDHQLEIGERIVFEDMNHYTNVKTNMFNGITHPSISLRDANGEIVLLRKYDYCDYKNRMC